MLCPKCGKEYEGSECPYCSGPKILVNDSDYQKRRMAYEKKQAGVKSASSDNQANTDDFDPTELVDRVKKGSKKSKDYLSEKTEQIKSYTVKKAKDVKLPYSGKGGLVKMLRQNKRTLIMAAVILVAAILSAVGIYQLVVRKNYVLYMSSKGKIYNVSGIETKFVVDSENAIFAVDGNTFYTPNYPDEIDRSLVVETMASDSGKYFACETYDVNSMVSALYLWNDNNCYKVLESKQEKSIKYVTDKGKVIFTDSNVARSTDNNSDNDDVNHEGAVTNIDYYVYDHSNTKNNQNKDSSKTTTDGTLIKIDKNLKSAHLYSEKNLLICLDSSNQLYLYNYKDQSRKSLDINVTNVYSMLSEQNDVYADELNFVNTSKNADSFFYSTDGGSYYYSITDNNAMLIGKETSTDTKFVNLNHNQIYVFQIGKVFYTSVNNGKVSGLNQIDTLGSSFSLITQSSNVLYINADNNLMTAIKGTAKKLEDNVADGTLTRVENTTEAFTYWKDGMQHYRKSLSDKAVKMTGVTEQIKSDHSESATGKNLGQIIYYKNKLYFYDTNGKLHSCTTKGNDNNLIGEVEQFWLGTELK